MDRVETPTPLFRSSMVTDKKQRQPPSITVRYCTKARTNHCTSNTVSPKLRRIREESRKTVLVERRRVTVVSGRRRHGRGPGEGVRGRGGRSKGGDGRGRE